MRFFKLSNYAPGIPEKGLKADIPNIQNAEWDYSVQRHEAKRAGIHYDLRLSDGTKAFSFAIRNGLPSTGQKHLAVRVEDHDPAYMGFSGEIEAGYGAGKVSLVESGKADVIKSTPDKISFNLYKGNKIEQYHLIRTGNDSWLILNNTPTRETRKEIPTKKVKARSTPINKIPDTFGDPDKILTAKIDGAASVFVLRKNKSPEVFSYRRSKRGPELINRTPKYDSLRNVIVPKSLDNTVLWGEAFVTNAKGKSLPHRETAGLLNANVWKAKDRVKSEGLKFENVIFNVEKFKGKDFSKEPYEEKIKALNFINSLIPELKLPPLAVTPNEKQRLFDDIYKGKHPLTGEGYVVWDRHDWRPTKSKKKADTELYVQGFEEGQGKYIGALGKLIATPDVAGKGPRTRVGGGFTDDERRQIWSNQQKFLGLPITIEYQEALPSGKYRMPIYKSFRQAEFWPTEN